MFGHISKKLDQVSVRNVPLCLVFDWFLNVKIYRIIDDSICYRCYFYGFGLSSRMVVEEPDAAFSRQAFYNRIYRQRFSPDGKIHGWWYFGRNTVWDFLTFIKRKFHNDNFRVTKKELMMRILFILANICSIKESFLFRDS